MKLKLITLLALSLSTGLASCSTANAHASHSAAQAKPGHWQLNPNKCPDLVEDRRDRRESRIDEAYDRSRRDVMEDIRDRRESRRDEAYTHCPASAWEWHGPRYRAHYHAPKPKTVKVYYHPHKKHYYHSHGQKKVVVHW